MKIGVLSDSHANVAAARKAGLIFQREGVQAVFHAGDIGSPAILEEIVRHLPAGTPLYAVLGNMDPAILRCARMPAGVHIRSRALKVTLAGKSICILHGDQESVLLDLLKNGSFDYLFTGHTHRAQILRRGKTCWINPGALHRTSQPSVALVDLETGAVTIMPLEDPAPSPEYPQESNNRNNFDRSLPPEST